MKKFLKHTSAFLCFILVLALTTHTISGVLLPSHEGLSKAIQDFYKIEDDSLDLLILGDSSTYRSVNPNIIWNERGMTSYVLGAAQARVYSLYYILKDTLKNQHPQCVVFEVNSMFNEHEYKLGNKRKIIDNIPLSWNKIDMIQDPVFELSKDEQLSMLFPITLYKNRYSELSVDDIYRHFSSNPNSLKGFAYSDTIKPYYGDLYYMYREQNITLPPTYVTYLQKIKDLCDEHQIPLLLLKVPGAREWNKTKNDLITNLAYEMDLPFYNMNNQTIELIDWTQDTNDAGVHLNVFGAEKVTRSLIDYLDRNYAIQSFHTQTVVDSYNEAYNSYISRFQ